jgi:hypothetical protein
MARKTSAGVFGPAHRGAPHRRGFRLGVARRQQQLSLVCLQRPRGFCGLNHGQGDTAMTPDASLALVRNAGASDPAVPRFAR